MEKLINSYKYYYIMHFVDKLIHTVILTTYGDI